MNENLNYEDFLSLVEDYANSVAKRYGLKSCTPESLLLAISELSPTKFSTLAPTTQGRCRTFLASTFSDAVIEECDVRLVGRTFEGLSALGEFWGCVKNLTESADVQRADPGAISTSLPIREEIQINVPIPTDRESPLSETFLRWCAEQTGVSLDVIVQSVTKDQLILDGLSSYPGTESNL